VDYLELNSGEDEEETQISTQTQNDDDHDENNNEGQPAKKKRKVMKKSYVWGHVEKINIEIDRITKQIVKCKLCDWEVEEEKRYNSTTNIKNHLERQHGIVQSTNEI
jgi:hypothetical protein